MRLWRPASTHARGRTFIRIDKAKAQQRTAHFPTIRRPSCLPDGHGHARHDLELGCGVRFPSRNFQETARGEGRQKIAGSDEPVRLHEGGCHFISADRHGEAVAERPRPLDLRPRDVREPVGLPRNRCTQSNCRKDAALTMHFRLSIPSWESAILGSNPTGGYSPSGASPRGVTSTP